jgi:hypothetical protein
MGYETKGHAAWELLRARLPHAHRTNCNFVMKFGTQLVSISGGVRYYIETPPGGPEWGLRLVFTLLFPK